VIPQLTYLPLSPGRKFAAKTPPFLSCIVAGMSCWVQMIHGIFHSRSEDALDPTGASMCPSFSYYFKDSFSPLNSHKPLSPKRLPRCPSRGGIIEIFVVSHMTQREKVNGVMTSLTASALGDVDTCALRIPVPIIHIHVIYEQVYWHGVVHASHTEEIPDQGGSGIEKKYAMPIFFLRPVWLD
jgi:hypothetical protein